MELRIGLLCLLLVYTDITHSAAPVCKSGCVGQNNNVLKLQEGTTYVYNLEGKTETSVPKTKGPNGESTKLNIRAKVEVNVQAKCAALIKLKNVQITGPDDKKHGSLTKLEENPLRVSLNGGSLAPQICTVPEDDYTSLNIKRAIASLLQINSAESATIPQEVDVFGSCPTIYNIRQDGGNTIVRKNRDLNKCAYRENIRQEIFSIPTAGNSDLQSSPLLEPTFEAEIRIKGGIVESASAEESYLLRPFSDKSNGVRTKISTKLTLESKAAGSIPDTTKEPRSIIFENPHEVVSSSIQSVLAALHKVADNTVGLDAARNVAELVAIIRRASADDLLSVYGQVKAGAGFKNKNLAKKVFTDALFRSGSGDSVAVAVELLKSREIVGDNAKLWFLSFALARHVSSKALDKATTLLDDATLPKEAYLGIGALAGKFCREHLCESVPQFENLVKKLAAPLANAVPANRQDENKIVAALKALRNIKKLTDEAANKVAAVIKETKAPTRVRVAALETAVSDACKNKLQKAAADVLNNREEDSELRIKAYLVLVECPNPKTANKLSEMLDNENVNQVGAFITSHLRNLRASAKPDRQEAKALLQNVKPIKRYPIDIRKFSQNHELSYDIDALGSSASLDSNIIFSQKSYLPRSANLNLTAEFFGHAFNLIEITGRAENLEKVVESFFGPKGYLRNTKPENIFKDSENELKKLKQHLDEKYKRLTRSKRSVTRESLASFGEKVKLRNSELDDNLDVDVSLRLLGNELLWVNLGEKSTSPEEVIDKVAEVLERGFGQTKDFDQRIQNHAVLIDSELAYPTSTGLPLKLTATGTSVVHLKVAGSLDLAALLKNPKKGEAKIEVRPSASVEIVGQMSIDGYAVEAGVKLAATLHTATGSEVTVKMLDGQGIDLNIGLPIKESDILTVQTEVVVAVRERGQPQTTALLDFQIPRKDFQGCFDQLLPVVGLTLCGKVGFPNDPQAITSGAALYPLNGHSKLSLRLDKEDESLTTYHFRLQYSLTDPTNRRIEALIETPGSKNPREISLLAEAKTVPNKEINLKLITPLYKLRGQALITDSNSEYTLSGLAELEGVFSYKARFGVLINGDTYTPIVEYTPLDDKQPKTLKVEGTVTVEKAGPAKRTYKFNNVRLISPGQEVSVDGSVTKDVNLFQTDLKIGYGKQNIGVKTKLQRQGENNLKINAEITPSQYPDFGFGLKYEYQRDKTHVENSLSVVHGRDLTSKQARLSIFQQITYNVESIHKFDVSTKNSLTYPLFAVEGKLEGAATEKSVHYDLLLAYEKNTITSKLNAKTGITKPGDYAIDFSAAALEHGVKFETKRSIVAANKSKFTNVLTLTPGGKYTLDADVTHQLDKNNIDTRLDVTVKVEGSKDPYKFDVGLVLNPQERGAHSKIGQGAKILLDAEVNQKTEISGSFRLNIHNALESNGKYKLNKNKAVDADALINIIPVKRKLTATAKLTVNAGNHVGTIDILYDADKDPSKKISIKTETLIGSKAINSKNKISEGGREILLDFNGEAHGKPGNGGVSGGYDITLPNGLHLVARGKQSLRIIPGNSDAALFLDFGYSLEAGKPLTKLTIDTSARNVDLNRYAFDTKFETAFSCENGDAYYKQSARSTPTDGKLLIELQNSFGGSHLGEWQYNGKTKITANRAEVSYHTTAALSTKYSLDVQGKLHPGVEDKAYGLEQTLSIKTPAESAKDIKLVTAARYVQGDGAKPCQLKLGQEISLDGKTFKLGFDGTGSKTEGSAKGNLELPNVPAYNGQIKYKHNHENELLKSEVGLEASHDDKKINLNVKADYTKTLTLFNIHVTGATPFEKAKKIDITGNYKKISTVAGNLDIKALVNEDKADIAAKYDFTTNHLLLDNNLALNGDKYRLYFKWDRKTDRSGRFEEQILWANNGGGQYDVVSTYDLESLENFIISVTLNSEKYNINNLKIDLGNRPSKSGAANKVNLSAANKEGKIFVGSASYAIKDDENGYSIEGKGTVNYGSESFPLTYKIATTRLSKNANNELGVRTLISVDFGKGVYKFDSKYSDKELRYDQKFCYDKKCSGAELLHSYQVEGIAKTTTQLVAKAYNEFPQFTIYKLEIKGNSKRDGLLSSSEVTATLRDVTYSAQHYVRSNEAAIIATAPTREIALISTYQLPTLKQTPTVVKADASLYLDHKKNPSDKATLALEGTFKNENNQAIVGGIVKFSHPSLQRPLSVKGEASVDLKENAAKAGLEVDVLSKKSQKIILSAEAKQLIVGNGRNFTATAQLISKGLVVDLGAGAHSFFDREGASIGASAYYVDDKNMKKDAAVLLAANLKESEILLRVPGHTLLEGSATVTQDKDVRTLNAELTIAEGETGVLKATVTGYREIKASLNPKSEPKRSLNGLISLTKEKAEIRAERLDNGKVEPLVSAVIHLDEANLFKLDYDINAENLKKPLKYFENLLKSTIDRLQVLAGSLSKEINSELINLSEALKKAQPNFKELIQQYQNAFKAIREELEKDPNYQQLAAIWKKLFGGVLDVIEAQIKVIITSYEKIAVQVTDVQVKLVEAYKKISPDLIDAYKKIVAVFAEASKKILEIASKAANEFLELVRQHEQELKAIINSASESFQDIGRITIKQVTQLRNELRDLLNLIVDQVKSLPIYDNAKERLQELLHFELPPHFFELFEELSATAQDFMPTPQLKELVKAVFSYLEKRLKRQAVDDVAEISAISKLAIGAADSLIGAIKEYFGVSNLDTKSIPLFGFNVPIPLPSASILKLPELGNIRISPLNLLAAINEFPSPMELYTAYRPKLNILENIPPFRTYGTILKGHHFFTFDKQHLTLKGSCSYILAQDFQDGNFSVVANLENGKVRSLTIADKTDVVELLNDNTVVLNGKASDLPVNTDQINGWRRYGSTNIKIKAGVFVTHYIPSDIYVIRVSGFYFGRTRGLLGTINNEVYDELTLPNGHLAKNSAELANAYAVGQCAPATPVAAVSKQAPECTSFFTSDSSLRVYFHTLNPAPYREACDSHVGMGHGDAHAAACDVAVAYVHALRQEGILFASIPAECAQCKVNGKKLELGQTEQVKAPSGKADVVIVIEQSSQNEQVFKNAMAPFIAQVTADLKTRGISDVEFALIGFGAPDQKWPQHYGNNGKYTYAGKSDNINFGDKERLTAPYDTIWKKVKYVQRFIEVELGMEQIVYAMNEANRYPFRAGASKTIILINTTPCSRSPIFPISLQTPRILNIYRYYREHGLNFHIVSPLAGLEKKDIIGFDSEKVYTLANPEGVTDRSGLTYVDDFCLGFSQYYGGAAFSSQNFVNAQPDQKKKIIEVTSQRIANGAVKYTNTEDCTCTLRSGVFAAPECTVASYETKV